MIKICKKCRIGRQFYTQYSSYCVECSKRRATKSYYKNRWGKIQYSRERYRKYRKEILAKCNDKGKRLLYKYNLSQLEFDNLLQAQNGKCAICSKLSNKPLHVNYDYNTKKVRALLCLTCNFGIGKLRDSEILLEQASKYIKVYKLVHQVCFEEVSLFLVRLLLNATQKVSPENLGPIKAEFQEALTAHKELGKVVELTGNTDAL